MRARPSLPTGRLNSFISNMLRRTCRGSSSNWPGRDQFAGPCAEEQNGTTARRHLASDGCTNVTRANSRRTACPIAMRFNNTPTWRAGTSREWTGVRVAWCFYQRFNTCDICKMRGGQAVLHSLHSFTKPGEKPNQFLLALIPVGSAVRIKPKRFCGMGDECNECKPLCVINKLQTKTPTTPSKWYAAISLDRLRRFLSPIKVERLLTARPNSSEMRPPRHTF